MFAWVQIVNDVTILGEQLRRNRRSEGAARAARVLFRLLEFLGYYLYTKGAQGDDEFADAVAKDLRRESYRDLFSNGPREGPTRWILAKYPHVCSKCGEKPCHCLLWPWVLEERRESPGPYEPFREKAELARARLRDEKENTRMSLAEMLAMFEGIYKNSYYHQEAWKVGMHLSEELGEATIELSRLELAWRGHRKFNVQQTLPTIVKYAQAKIDAEIKGLRHDNANDAAIQKRREVLQVGLKKEEDAFSKGDPWEVFRQRVSEKFKEEVADVFSWLSAVLVKLDPNRDVLQEERTRFVWHKGTLEYLRCPWCGSGACTDECLVTHSVSSEITEKITKF